MKPIGHIIIILIAVLAIFLEVQKTSIYYIWSIANQASFEEAYCVNLEYPELDCHGSCQVNTSFNELSTSPEIPLTISSAPTLDITYFLALLKRPTHFYIDNEQVTHLFMKENYAYEFPNSILRPPIA